MRTTRLVHVDERILELSNLDKPLWPEDGITKADYLAYLRAVAAHMLPHLRDRLLVVTRYPDGIHGEGFYQKDCPDHAPSWVATAPYWSRDSRRWIRFVLCQDTATLIWLGNLACLEFHPWPARAADPDRPDRAVFDLDPAPPLGFEEAREAAFLVRAALEALGLRSWPKTSGATGIHVCVPIAPRHRFPQVAAFVRAVAELLLRRRPELLTLERAVARRRGRVYVDYLQNARGKTIVAAYSPRPLPGAPVSCPVTWEELESCRPENFHLRSVPERLRSRGDPMAPLLACAQPLDGALRALGLA